MDDNQEWGKQLDEERIMQTIDVLRRVDQHISRTADVLFLCSELGIQPEHLTKA